MNEKKQKKNFEDTKTGQAADGISSGVGLAWEIGAGLFSGFVGVFFNLIGMVLGFGVFVVIIGVLCYFGYKALNDVDWSQIDSNVQTFVDDVKSGDIVSDEIEGEVVAAQSYVKEPTTEEIEQARREHEAEAENYKKRHDGDEYPFTFREPKARQVTEVEFADGRRKTFSGVSPVPIPEGKYVVIKYNSFTSSISEVTEKTVEEKVDEPEPNEPDSTKD